MNMNCSYHPEHQIIAICLQEQCKRRIVCVECQNQCIQDELNSIKDLQQLKNRQENKSLSFKTFKQFEEERIKSSHFRNLLREIILDLQQVIDIFQKAFQNLSLGSELNLNMLNNSQLINQIIQLSQLKALNDKLQLKQLSQQIKNISRQLKEQDMPWLMDYCIKNFVFDQTIQDKGMQVKNRGLIADFTQPEATSAAFFLCEPMIPEKSVAIQKFRVENNKSSIYIGVCCKKKIQKTFINHQDLEQIGHGFFLIDRVGHIYSSLQKEINYVKSNFNFEKQNTILVIVDRHRSQLTWKLQEPCNVLCDHMVFIKHNAKSIKIPSDGNLFLCVGLYYEKIELIHEN